MNDPNDLSKDLAKAAGEAVVKEVGRFLQMVIGGPLKGIGGIASDQVSYWRYKNLLKLKDKVDAIHAERALEGKTAPIPPRYAIPLIDASSTEDDETIQNMWAGLIANATDHNTRLDVKKIYIDVLQKLEPLDALVLIYLSGKGIPTLSESGPEEIDIAELEHEGVSLKDMATSFKISEEEIAGSLVNLHRLECLKVMRPNFLSDAVVSFQVGDEYNRYDLSDLGLALLKACEASEKTQ